MSKLQSLAPQITSTKWDYKYNKVLLSNGATLVLVRQAHLHQGTLSVNIGTGSRFESPSLNGISHFLEHMVFRGTNRFPTSLSLNIAIEKLGGTFAASTTPDTTEFSVTLPPETLLEGAELLAELVISPRFNKMETERGIIVEEIKEGLDEHGASIDIDDLSRARLWPNHPLGFSVTGPVENVERFTIADLSKRFKDAYTGSNTVICATGAFDPEALTDALEKAFKAMPCAVALPRPVTPQTASKSSFYHAHKPGSQTQIRAAFHAPGFSDKDYAAAEVLIRLIDDGMSTPLHRRIFEEKGLAYNVCADLETYYDTGALNFDAVCSHENVSILLDEILDIAWEFKAKLVSSEELEKATKRAVWDFKILLDNPEAMNAWYGEQQLVRTPPPLEKEALALTTVTREDILKVADKIFYGAALHVTTVGVQNNRQIAKLQKTAETF